MEAIAGLGFVGGVFIIVLAMYPFLALGRIWLYSKQQVQLLRDIRAILQKERAS